VPTDQKHRSDLQKRKHNLKQNNVIHFILPLMDTWCHLWHHALSFNGCINSIIHRNMMMLILFVSVWLGLIILTLIMSLI